MNYAALRLLVPCIAIILNLGLATIVTAADGDFDLDFANEGVLSLDTFGGTFVAEGIAIQPAGDILIAGMIWSATGDDEFLVIRVDQNGAIDTSFGVDGEARVNVGAGREEFGDIVVHPDGSILFTGITPSSDPDEATVVIKLDSNGSLDPGFGTGGVVTSNEIFGGDDQVDRIALEPSGRILIGLLNTVVLALLPDGTRDLSFGGGLGRMTSPHGVAPWGIAVDGVGRIVTAGGIAFSGAQDPSQKILATRYMPDGSLDTSFGDAGLVTLAIGSSFHAVYDLVIGPDGKIYLSVLSTDPSIDSAVVRLLPDGSLDTSFGVSGVAHVAIPGDGTVYTEAIELLPDGRIILSGYGTSFGVFYELIVVALNPDGSLDNSFGLGGWQGLDSRAGTGNFFIPSGRAGIAVHPSGRILVLDPWVSGAISLMTPTWDLTPDALPFTSLTNVVPGTTQQSSVSVTGLDTGISVPFRITGGSAATDSSPTFSSLPSWLTGGGMVTVQHQSSGTPGQSTTTTIEAGGIQPRNNRALILGPTVFSEFQSTAGTPVPAAEYDLAPFVNLISNATIIDFEGYADPGEFTFLGNPGQFTESGVTISNNSQMFLQNNDYYGTGAFLSPQGTDPHIVDITLPVNTVAVGFFYSSAAATAKLDGGQVFDLPAVNPGSLGFFGVAREVPIQALHIEVNGPGIDLENLFFSDTFQFSELPLLTPLPDINNDGTDDLSVLREGSINAEIRSGTSGALQKTITFLSNDFTPVDAAALPDSDGNGVTELAVLATRNSDGRIVVEIRNITGAEAPRFVWFAADHTPLTIKVIDDDADGNGVAELAVLSTRNSDGRIVVEVKNAFGPTNPNTVWYMSGNTPVDLEVVPDKDANGVPEVAVLSFRNSDGRIVTEVKNAAGPTAPTAVWFMPGNTAIDLVAVDDKDANGIPEVAVLSSRISDGRNVVEIKNASGPTAPTTVWFMAGNTATDVAHIHDADSNGVPEVAVLSVRDSDGRIVVEVKNVTGPTSPNTMWYSSAFTARGMATIADTDGNATEEALVLMIRDSDGRILVQGRNAAGNPAPNQYWFSP